MEVDRWINGTALGNVHCASSNFTCSDCLNDQRDNHAVICHNSTVFPKGLLATVGAFCGQCPSGCGPFRNQGSMYQTLVSEIDSWPYAAQKGLQYIGTLPVAVCVVFVLMLVLHCT